jgi:serine kinase of HPr protein (carbohydrate metabolism regulator)
VLIEGPPGSGKSSLALALIDRGAKLVGDDSVRLEVLDGRLIAHPHPETRGFLEVRNLGLVELPVCEAVPVALLVRLDSEAPRFIEELEQRDIEGVHLPMIALWPGGPVLALKVEMALSRFGVEIE